MKKVGRIVGSAFVIAIILGLAIGLGFQLWRFLGFIFGVFTASAAANLTDTLIAGIAAVAAVIFLFVTLALMMIAESIGRVANAIEAKSLIDVRGLRITFTNRDGRPEEILIDSIVEVPPE